MNITTEEKTNPNPELYIERKTVAHEMYKLHLYNAYAFGGIIIPGVIAAYIESLRMPGVAIFILVAGFMAGRSYKLSQYIGQKYGFITKQENKGDSI